MPTNAQLQAEIDRLNQAMAERTRVPSNLPKFTGKRGEDVREWLFQIENACRINGIAIDDANPRLPGIAGSAMEKPASGWFLHWASATRVEEHTWGIFREHVLQHFEASNYQSVLREKLQRLKQTADIETYNGEYSALIFRVEGMSVLDQVLFYGNGLKPRTRSYVKLENPETLSDAMDLAVKFEVTHFVEDASERKVRHEKKKTSSEQEQENKKTSKGKSFRGKGRFKPSSNSKSKETRTCHFCNKPGHIKANCFAWKKEKGKQGNEKPLYKSRPLFAVSGGISVASKMTKTSKMLLDCGATTIYVSKRWVEEHQLKTTKFSDKNIRVKLGDNQIVEAPQEVLPLRIRVAGLDDAYDCVAVVYAIPEEYDCILGIPFFEDMQPQIDWKGRRVEGTRERTLRWERAGETCGPIEEGGPVIASGLRRSVGAKGLSAKRPDSCRGAALETDVKSASNPVHDSEQSGTPRVVAYEQLRDASTGKGSAGEDERKSSGRDGTARSSGTRGRESVVEKMFTMGVMDDAGVQTKFITRKKLRKFLRIKTKSIEEPYMLVLTNETIKNVARSLERRDQPDNVGTAKAQRYLETDWESFRTNPAFDLLTKYKNTVFRPELPEGLPEKREIEHRIDVKDPNLAMYRQQWRQSPEQQREIVLWVEDMVKKKLIRPSISPHAAPTFCVRKPVGWRIVHDYRYLNSNTIRQSIPMTRKEDILDAMAGGYWFSTMDLMSAYYQVRMRAEDIKFTAFQAPNGLWEYMVLPMGVCNAPATMHRLTSKLFRDLENTKSFYDDIYIFTKSQKIEDHLEALRKTLDILRDNKLYVKLSKCVFCADEIPCLGDFVGRIGVRMDPDKVQTIRDWPIPRTQEELHSFLGLTGYVQRFCPDYAKLTASMFNLLKKKTKRNAKIRLDEEQSKNFKELKRRLCNPPVLHLPNFKQPMRLRTDASKFAVGGVLFQVVDGVERPIAYTSRKMKSAELNYPTQQQELLAIVHALAAFRIYCLDKPPIVETDHKSLEGLFTQKMANRRLARWYDILAEYQPTFSYLPGAKNGIADALSRRPDLQPETKFFHDLSVTSFDDTSFSLAISEVTTDSELVTKIKLGYTRDREAQAIFTAIKRRTDNSEPKAKKNQQKQYRCYTEGNGLLWYQTPSDDFPRIVVPNDVKLRQAVIRESHDTNYGGHPGAERTYLTLTKRWYWTKMLKSIRSYIADCELCRRNKPRLTKPPGLLEPLQVPDERWRSISMDFITDLPRTKREVDSIWVVVDRLTKRCHFVPTTKKVDAEGVARLFIDYVWKLHEMPTSTVSDRDRKFVSTFWQHVFKSIGTTLNMTVAHRAQGDGQTERMNRTLEEYLRCYVGPVQDDWDIHLANAEFAVNSTVNSSIKMAPFEADLGFVPLNPLHLAAENLGTVPTSRRGAEFHERQAALLRRCQEALAEAQERMRDVYDRNRDEQVFSVGDRVYLSTKHLDPKHTGLPNSTKLGPKWMGPYTVVKKIHNHAYELNIQAVNKLHPVFNTGSLKPYQDATRLSRPQDVVLADGSVGQLVRRILGKRTKKRRTQFLVELVGEEKPTWEPIENLSQVPNLIADFEAIRRKKRRRR